jgi:hypothetical protein
MLLKQYIRILDMDSLKKFMRYAFVMNYQKGAYLTNTKIDVPRIMMTLNSMKDCV